MKISVIDAGNFKLDGGAMFGVVPKTIWQKIYPADDNNMCSWKMRCLLIETEGKLILIDTGMGDKQPEKWQSYYYRFGEANLVDSIRKHGYHEDQITDVILSHLHFDHCGGAVKWNSRKDNYQLTFNNAIYWTHSQHWSWAMNPNDREKATFLSENLMPIKNAERLRFIDKEENSLPNSITFLIADGHTEKMIMPLISYQSKKILFIADTIPSHAHIHVPFCMSYDVRPLKTMEEKKVLLERAVKEDIILFFDHDLNYEACTIKKNERGFISKDMGDLQLFI